MKTIRYICAGCVGLYGGKWPENDHELKDGDCDNCGQSATLADAFDLEWEGGLPNMLRQGWAQLIFYMGYKAQAHGQSCFFATWGDGNTSAAATDAGSLNAAIECLVQASPRAVVFSLGYPLPLAPKHFVYRFYSDGDSITPNPPQALLEYAVRYRPDFMRADFKKFLEELGPPDDASDCWNLDEGNIHHIWCSAWGAGYAANK